MLQTKLEKASTVKEINRVRLDPLGVNPLKGLHTHKGPR